MNRKGDIYGYSIHHNPHAPASDRDMQLWESTCNAVEALDNAALQAEYDALPPALQFRSPVDLTKPDERDDVIGIVAGARCSEHYLNQRSRKAALPANRRAKTVTPQ